MNHTSIFRALLPALALLLSCTNERALTSTTSRGRKVRLAERVISSPAPLFDRAGVGSSVPATEPVKADAVSRELMDAAGGSKVAAPATLTASTARYSPSRTFRVPLVRKAMHALQVARITTPGPASPDGGGTNVWAIVGFVCTFFIPLLGIIFSVIALGQIKRTGERGRGLALAGLIISIVSMLIVISILA